MSIKLLNPSLKQNNRKINGRIFLIYVFCIIAILQSGLRNVKHLSDENDTIRYQYSYENILNTSWSQILQNFSFYSTDYGERDLGYPIFVKLTQFLCDDFTFFMFLTATIFLVPFSLIIYRYVKSNLGIILSFLIYFSLYTNIVNSFMRQAIALGIILYGVKYIINSNWKKYYFILAIAFVIHSSAVLAIPLYFLTKFVKSRKLLLWILIISPILMQFTPILIKLLSTGSVYENYGDEVIRTPINYIMYLFFAAILCYFSYNRIIIIPNCKVLIAGILGTTLLLPLIWMGGTAIRISYYYSIFVIPIISLMIDNIIRDKNSRNVTYTISIIFFLFLTLK
mgnify:CR=1 FL=1